MFCLFVCFVFPLLLFGMIIWQKRIPKSYVDEKTETNSNLFVPLQQMITFLFIITSDLYPLLTSCSESVCFTVGTSVGFSVTCVTWGSVIGVSVGGSRSAGCFFSSAGCSSCDSDTKNKWYIICVYVITSDLIYTMPSSSHAQTSEAHMKRWFRVGWVNRLISTAPLP